MIASVAANVRLPNLGQKQGEVTTPIPYSQLVPNKPNAANAEFSQAQLKQVAAVVADVLDYTDAHKQGAELRRMYKVSLVLFKMWKIDALFYRIQW